MKNSGILPESVCLHSHPPPGLIIKLRHTALTFYSSYSFTFYLCIVYFTVILFLSANFCLLSANFCLFFREFLAVKFPNPMKSSQNYTCQHQASFVYCDCVFVCSCVCVYSCYLSCLRTSCIHFILTSYLLCSHEKCIENIA